jgi:hypothetical protein
MCRCIRHFYYTQYSRINVELTVINSRYNSITSGEILQLMSFKRKNLISSKTFLSKGILESIQQLCYLSYEIAYNNETDIRHITSKFKPVNGSTERASD